MIDVSAEVHKAIWESSDPYQSQLALLNNLVSNFDSNNLQNHGVVYEFEFTINAN